MLPKQADSPLTAQLRGCSQAAVYISRCTAPMSYATALAWQVGSPPVPTKEELLPTTPEPQRPAVGSSGWSFSPLWAISSSISQVRLGRPPATLPRASFMPIRHVFRQILGIPPPACGHQVLTWGRPLCNINPAALGLAVGLCTSSLTSSCIESLISEILPAVHGVRCPHAAHNRQVIAALKLCCVLRGECLP